MNTNQIHGFFSSLAGLVQEKVGKRLGSRRQQMRGLQKRVLGRAEKNLGDLQAAAKHAVNSH